MAIPLITSPVSVSFAQNGRRRAISIPFFSQHIPVSHSYGEPKFTLEHGIMPELEPEPELELLELEPN